MQHDHVGYSRRPDKRKGCFQHGNVRAKKALVRKAVVPNQFQGDVTNPHVAFDCLSRPDFNDHKPPKPMRRRYYPFSITKMSRLVIAQSRFLYQYIHYKNPTNCYTSRYKALSHHIGVCKASPTSSKLAFYYACNTTIRGMCMAKHKKRKCIVLGMEHRQEAPSYRLYLAYFSPSCFHRVCKMRFLIKQILYSHFLPNALTKTIFDFCFNGIEKAGFEIVGAHYMDPKHAKGRPSFFTNESVRPRTFTDMWNGQMMPKTKQGLNYIMKHARRDIQITDLRVESIVYMNLLCGKL